MMKNMSPEQIANMQRMAAGMMGGGGMPGAGMPGQFPGAGMAPPQVPAQAPTQALPPAQKADLDKAETLKQEANALFK